MFGMFGIGMFELLVIGAILTLMVGVPIVVIVIVLALGSKSTDRPKS
jgi:hypothetical protein